MESNEKHASGPPGEEVDFGFSRLGLAEHTSRVRGVFDSVAGRYDLMNDLMSGGLHRIWKSALLDRLNPQPRQLLVDVAGGTGDIADGFLKRGGGRALICDINREMLTAGQDRSLDRGVTRGPGRICGDAADLPLPDAFADACTIVFGLRNVTRRRDALAEMRRVLKPGGHFICMEFSPAVLPQLKPVYDAYSFRVLPWLGERVAADGDSYRYLAESIRKFPDPETLSGEMADAGFGNISTVSMTGGIVWLHSGWRT